MLNRTLQFALIIVIVFMALPIFASPTLNPADITSDVQRLANEVYNQGNMNTVDELFSTSYVSHPGSGLQAYKQSVQSLRAAFPNLHATSDLVTVQGDQVAFHSTITGTFVNALQSGAGSIAPTGMPVTIVTNVFLRYDDSGKIAEEWDYGDTLDTLAQLGVIRVPMVKLTYPTVTPELAAQNSTGTEGVNAATIQTMFNNLIVGNHLDDAAQVFSPDFVQVTGLASVNLDGWKTQISNLQAALSNLSVTSDNVVAQGDLVAIHFTIRGTFTNTLVSADGFQLAPNNQTVTLPGSMILRFDNNGNVIQSWQTYDSMNLLGGVASGGQAA